MAESYEELANEVERGNITQEEAQAEVAAAVDNAAPAPAQEPAEKPKTLIAFLRSLITKDKAPETYGQGFGSLEMFNAIAGAFGIEARGGEQQRNDIEWRIGQIEGGQEFNEEDFLTTIFSSDKLKGAEFEQMKELNPELFNKVQAQIQRRADQQAYDEQQFNDLNEIHAGTPAQAGKEAAAEAETPEQRAARKDVFIDRWLRDKMDDDFASDRERAIFRDQHREEAEKAWEEYQKAQGQQSQQGALSQEAEEKIMNAAKEKYFAELDKLRKSDFEKYQNLTPDQKKQMFNEIYLGERQNMLPSLQQSGQQPKGKPNHLAAWGGVAKFGGKKFLTALPMAAITTAGMAALGATGVLAGAPVWATMAAAVGIGIVASAGVTAIGIGMQISKDFKAYKKAHPDRKVTKEEFYMERDQKRYQEFSAKYQQEHPGQEIPSQEQFLKKNGKGRGAYTKGFAGKTLRGAAMAVIMAGTGGGAGIMAAGVGTALASATGATVMTTAVPFLAKIGVSLLFGGKGAVADAKQNIEKNNITNKFEQGALTVATLFAGVAGTMAAGKLVNTVSGHLMNGGDKEDDNVREPKDLDNKNKAGGNEENNENNGGKSGNTLTRTIVHDKTGPEQEPRGVIIGKDGVARQLTIENQADAKVGDTYIREDGTTGTFKQSDLDWAERGGRHPVTQQNTQQNELNERFGGFGGDDNKIDTPVEEAMAKTYQETLIEETQRLDEINATPSSRIWTAAAIKAAHQSGEPGPQVGDAIADASGMLEKVTKVHAPTEDLPHGSYTTTATSHMINGDNVSEAEFNAHREAIDAGVKTSAEQRSEYGVRYSDGALMGDGSRLTEEIGAIARESGRDISVRVNNDGNITISGSELPDDAATRDRILELVQKSGIKGAVLEGGADGHGHFGDRPIDGTNARSVGDLAAELEKRYSGYFSDAEARDATTRYNVKVSEEGGGFMSDKDYAQLAEGIIENQVNKPYTPEREP